jgi:hypothetical protein
MPSNEETNLISGLQTLLKEAMLTPRVRSERVVRSTLYDLDYHVAVIACVFSLAASGDQARQSGLKAHQLKLLQFVAMRPNLLGAFQRWASARLRPDLLAWQAMPRGFLGDLTHDRTIDLLVACGVLSRSNDRLVAGPRFRLLEKVYEEILESDLLQSEREAIRTLSLLKVSNKMIGGQ